MSVAQSTADAVRRVRLLLATEREALAGAVLEKLTPVFQVAHERVDSPNALAEALGRHPWDAVICDPPAGNDAEHCVGAIKAASRHGVPVIVISPRADDARAAPLLEAGAQALVEETRLDLLVPTIVRELAEARQRRDRTVDSLVRWAPDPLLIIDADGRILRVSALAQTLLGYSEKELAGTLIEQLVPESRRRRHAAHRAGYLQAPRFRPMGKGMEFPVLAKGGVEIPVEISLAPLELSGRTLVVCGIRDLRERLSRLAPLLAFSPDPMIVIGANGRIVRANRMLLELLGYAESELIGKPIELLVPEDLRARHAAHRALYMAAPHPRPMGRGMEFSALAKDGSEVPVEISLAPVQTDGERMIACGLRDLRERRRAERLMHAVLEGTAAETGEGFMRSLVQNMAEALQVRYAVVVEFVGDPPDRARVLALWDGREIAGPLEYPLAGTPCAKVRESGEFLALERVREAFPKARELAGLQAESYLGIRLSSAAGETLGGIAVLDTKPLKDPEVAKQVLRVFGARAGAELQRQCIERALTEQTKQLHAAQDMAHMVSLQWDVAADRIEWSRSPKSLLGPRPASGVYPPFKDMVHPEDRDAFLASREAAIAGQGDHNMEYRIVRTDGAVRWLAARARMTGAAAAGDRAGRMSIVLQDITERKCAELRLRESEQRMQGLLSEQRTIFQNALAGIVYARNRRIVRCNRAFADMLGYAPEDLIDKSTRIVYPSDEAYERFAKDAEEDFAQSGRHEGEKQLARADGGLVWVSYRVTPLDRADLSKGTVLVAVDITERKRAEEMMRESEARFRSLTQLSSDWFWQLDEHYRFMPIGAEADKSGIRPKEFVGKTPWDCPGTSLSEAEWADYRATLDARKVFREFEYSRPSADGVVRWVSVSGEPVFDEHGRFRGYRGTGRDITEQKKAAAALQESEQQLRRVLESVDEVVYAVELDPTDPFRGRVTFMSGKVAQVTGYRPEEFYADPSLWQSLLHPKDVAEIARQTQELHSKGGSATREYRLRHKASGEYVWMEDRVQFERDARGRVVRQFGIARDVTERKRSEDDLRRFRLAMDNSGDMIVIIDRDSMRFVDANPAVSRLLGYSREEFLSRGPQDVLPVSREDLERAYDALIADPAASGTLNSYYRCKDGSQLPFESTRRAVRSGDRWLIVAISRDIRQRLAAEEALRRSRDELRLIADSVPAMIAYFDSDCRYGYANLGYREFHTGSADAITGKSIEEIVEPAVAPLVRREIERALAGEARNYIRRIRRRSDGSLRELEVSLVPHRSGTGRVLGVYALLLDVTRRRRAEEALRLRTRAVESSVNSIMITEPTAEGQRIVYVNPAFERITGYTAAEVIGRHPRFMHGNDRDQAGIEVLRNASREQREGTALIRNYRKDGSLFWNELRVAPIADGTGRVTHMVGIGNDVTDRVRYQQEIERSANFDSLTGLPNRNLMNDRLAQALTQADRAGRRVAVQFVDLDNLKRINDSLGHEMGDKVIVAVGKRIAEVVRTGDTVARLGGDEFVLVLGDLRHDEDAAAVAAKVLNFIGTPLKVNGHDFVLTASMGVALYPKDGADAAALIRHADTALYRAKEEGRNCFRFFAPEMNERVVEFLALEEDLRTALGTFQFQLHYQPIVPIAGGEPLGAEALLRWRRADGRPVSPAQFIPIAEESGLIVPIGRWVMERAMQQAAEWNRGGREPLYVSINLSVRQFRDPGLIGTVKEALAKTGIRPDLVTFEITESAVMQNVEEAMRLLGALRGLGVKLSVDDFGTGYSSLAYLKRFPIDGLKIDRAFVKDIVTDRGDQALCRAIIDLGRAFSIDVIAEGVESQEQARLLSEYGCKLAQGYLFGRPVEAGGMQLA